MLAEGFLRVLRYREERKLASKLQRSQTHHYCADAFDCNDSYWESADPQTHSARAEILENLNSLEWMEECNGVMQKSVRNVVILSDNALLLPENVCLTQEELHDSQFQGLRVVLQRPLGLPIPGGPSPTPLTLDPDLTVGLDDCSLLEQYPDLQVADSGHISHTNNSPRNPNIMVSEVYQHGAPQVDAQQVPSIPDQGYLVMGASVNISLDLPGSGLEPMSNSVLNGLLDKQLEEVYMQHLTDNLARCHSDLGNSLLHGLVPPPQPSRQARRGLDSLEASLEVEGGEGKKMSYLSTHNPVPFSSNFSSPVLRISECENLQ